MIDEEATFKKYGYYARDLKPKSGKRIVAVCDECGKVREPRKRAYYVLCCKCANIKTAEVRHGENNPSWKGGRVTCICIVCNKEFLVYPYRVESARFCSDKCYRIFNRGENACNWRGGTAKSKYCVKWNEKFREYVRNKFDRKCFICGKTEAENKGRKLSVHHVSYDKLCGCADTEEDRKADDKTCQFVPLCMSCHQKVHYNRDKWEKFFMDKLHNKLNGWYI